MKTTYLVQSFSMKPSGKARKLKLEADTPITCSSEAEAINRAERTAEKRTGVIAVAQEYDEGSGEFGKLTILAVHGEVPEGLLEEF